MIVDYNYKTHTETPIIGATIYYPPAKNNKGILFTNADYKDPANNIAQGLMPKINFLTPSGDLIGITFLAGLPFTGSFNDFFFNFRFESNTVNNLNPNITTDVNFYLASRPTGGFHFFPITYHSIEYNYNLTLSPGVCAASGWASPPFIITLY
jgi:hypothetical protein